MRPIVQHPRLLPLAICLIVGLVVATASGQRSLPSQLDPTALEASQPVVLDMAGEALSVHYQTRWNRQDRLPLAEVPALLRDAIVLAEDRRYWQHGGIDWRARASAVWQALRAGRAVRGASTISEQVVRLLNPRPRTVWSRWIEGFEAMRLEARFDKSTILAFYLDQVPYGSHRRGIRQAARHYFGRDPATLSESEMLALAVMPRAPSRLDPHRTPGRLAAPMRRLAIRLVAAGRVDAGALDRLTTPPVAVLAIDDAVPAAHAIAEVRRRVPAAATDAALRSTLDRQVQREGQRLLEQRLDDLRTVGVRHGALLVAEIDGRQVRGWNVANADAADDEIGIDTVQVPRQPGSALKPFVYALALDSGWTAATRIADDPTAAHVGSGLHQYRNYSRQHYGTVSLREALGNSLNVPEVKALQFVGGPDFLTLLHRLGMTGLDRHPDVYGDGLALGNGEVTLAQLVAAYAALADQGRWQPLSLLADGRDRQAGRQALSRESASIIADILSDSRARLLEFGPGGLLRFPGQTAVKTGTSSDYRDAWCIAWNHAYVVGAWLGSLDGDAMDGVTGAIGPALLVRSMFGVLDRLTPPRPLTRAPTLVRAAVIDVDGASREEWFAAGTAPEAAAESASAPVAAVWDGQVPATPSLVQPFEGLRLAVDPRLPAAQQAFDFRLAAVGNDETVHWYVNDRHIASTVGPTLQWPLSRGVKVAYAEADDGRWRSRPVRFEVR